MSNNTDTKNLPQRTAVECTPRNGLPNFFHKLKSGEAVQVAYFGGSITAAPGWRIFTREWLAQRFSDCGVGEIHAAIGGTGSTLGMYRLEYDVLRHEPDLMFVEFAVNDSGTEPFEILNNIESIVRKSKITYPDLDICFVYTIAHEQMLAEYGAGLLPRAASTMEIVADRYGIPSIALGVEIAKRAESGKLVFKGKRSDFNEHGVAADGSVLFSEDGVHPLVETGHKIYAEVIGRSLEIIESVPAVCGNDPVGPPLASVQLDRAQIAPLQSSWLSGDWQKLESVNAELAQSFSHRMPAAWRAKPAAKLSFSFTGTHLGFYDLLGPDCGTIHVSIDGAEVVSICRFDPYCTYHRLGGPIVAAGLPDTRHEVEVTVGVEEPDKNSILFEHNRPDYESHPAKYTDIDWYVGGILVCGEIAP